MSLRDAPDTGSFSHLAGVDVGAQACQGLACFVARQLDPERCRDALSADPRVYCLGKCHASPASAAESARPHVESAASRTVVLERIGSGTRAAPTMESYRRHGGLAGLERALAMPREAVVREIEAARLRGRGGAGFPAGTKWRSAFAQPRSPKYVVCNADEGDPGAYVDRLVLEDDPYVVLEAMAIAAYAIGAEQGYVYVRREYPDAYGSLETRGHSRPIAGTTRTRCAGPRPRVRCRGRVREGQLRLRRGDRALNAIEGRRPEVRARPPFPTVRGLFGFPTLVHNVETLASVPWILREGAEAYAALGRGESRGTKVLSLNSLFRRPGLYEIDLGTPLSHVLFDLAGGLRTGDFAGVLIGGPLAGVIPPRLTDVPLTFEDLDEIGAALGHGGVIGFDAGTPIVELAQQVFRFGAYESCGKCTPCRVGSTEVEATLTTAATGVHGSESERAALARIVHALAATSLCGHGTGLAAFAQSLVRHYPDEVRAWFG